MKNDDILSKMHTKVIRKVLFLKKECVEKVGKRRFYLMCVIYHLFCCDLQSASIKKRDINIAVSRDVELFIGSRKRNPVYQNSRKTDIRNLKARKHCFVL